MWDLEFIELAWLAILGLGVIGLIWFTYRRWRNKVAYQAAMKIMAEKDRKVAEEQKRDEDKFLRQVVEASQTKPVFSFYWKSGSPESDSFRELVSGAMANLDSRAGFVTFKASASPKLIERVRVTRLPALFVHYKGQPRELIVEGAQSDVDRFVDRWVNQADELLQAQIDAQHAEEVSRTGIASAVGVLGFRRLNSEVAAHR